MNIFFLIAFFIISAIHLYASYHKNIKLRAYTKGFLLPALIGWYCCTAVSPSWIVIVALLTSWLGDVFLIFNGVKWFSIGGISFLVSHVFFSLAYAPQIVFGSIPLWLLILAIAIYFVTVCLLFKNYKTFLPKALFYPMFAYLLANACMNCFAFFQLISEQNSATVITFIGAVLFFASDASLFSVRFNKNSIFKSHFFVMLTYLFAEYLIVQGLVLLAA